MTKDKKSQWEKDWENIGIFEMTKEEKRKYEEFLKQQQKQPKPVTKIQEEQLSLFTTIKND